MKPADLATIAARRQRMRELARADRALHGRYHSAEEFLAAVEAFWGRDGYVTAADGRVHVACCPSCRPRSEPSWMRYPIVVGDSPGGGWTCFPSCGCSPSAIARALLEAERRRLASEIADLGEAA